MHWMFWTVLVVLVWVRFALFVHDFLKLSTRGGDFESSGMICLYKGYARFMQRMRVEGKEHVPTLEELGGRALIVAPNHTAGVDPVLVQAALDSPMEPRWMMAEDMRIPALEWLWRLGRVIFVDRSVRDASSIRAALRHLKEGGVLGVFPEGHIERPPRMILPFKGGVGMLVERTGALVLPVVIDGAPQVDPAWASLWTPGHVTLRFLAVRDYSGRGMSGEEISADLRRIFLEATGWAANERTPILGNGHRILVDIAGRYVDSDGRVVGDEEAELIRRRLNGADRG